MHFALGGEGNHLVFRLPEPLGFHLGWRVAPQVRISISVSLLVRAQGDPAEWPLGPLNRC